MIDVSKLESEPPPIPENHIRVAVMGNVDAGKSTLIGTLKSNTLDDGRGSSRQIVMKHKHELETGRTSDPVTHLVGFNEDGTICNSASVTKGRFSFPKNVHRVVTLLDVAGHEKYLKNTIQGMTQGMIDYALVLVNARQEPTHMTVHHLNLATSLGIPVIIVMTKVDGCPKDVMKDTKQQINRLIKSPEIGKSPFVVRNEKDIGTVVEKLHGLVPILSVSCVTGEGLDLLNKMLVSLPKRRHHINKINRPFEFLVEDIFNVHGIGSVVSGFVNAGEWKKGESVYVGPMSDGSYVETLVKSVQIARKDVNHVWAGHSATFALSLSKENRKKLRKGMVLLKEPVAASRSFTADVCILKGDGTTITKGRYQTVVHILHVKQAARVVDFTSLDKDNKLADSDDVLRPGNRATVRFQFLSRPEYIRKGMRVLLREGHVKGVGIVKEVYT